MSLLHQELEIICSSIVFYILSCYNWNDVFVVFLLFGNRCCHDRFGNSIYLVLPLNLFIRVCQCLATCRWFSSSTPVSSPKNTDSHDITEILLKVALNTITLSLTIFDLKLSMERCSQYESMWSSFSVTCRRSEILQQ